MRTQKCSRCGAVLDVSALDKGSKFSCSACGTVLTVGEAAAVRRSLQESGPAYKPRTSGAAPASASTAGAPTRSQRAAAGGEGYEAAGGPAKSKAPLVFGVGGVVVAGAVLAFVLSRGGGASTGTGGTSHGGTSASVPAPKVTPEEWWERAQRNADGSPRTFDGAVIEKLLSEAQERNYASNAAFWKPVAERLYGDLLKFKPTHRQANEFFGKKSLLDYPDFEKVLEEIQGGASELPPDMRAFVESIEDRIDRKDPLWMDAAEYDKHKAELEKIQSWRKQAEADPRAREIQKGINRARNDPVLRNYGSIALDVHPFIVFLSSRELFPKPVPGETEEQMRERVAKKTEELQPRIERLKKLYTAYLKEFEERYRKPLGLPEFRPTDILFQWIFEDREGFDRFTRDQSGHEIGAGVLGFFSPQDRGLYLYDREDEDDGGISNDNVITHESTHQLNWFFSRDPDPRKRLEFRFDEFEASWFVEGWAEYLGGSCRVRPDTGELQFCWYALGRADLLRFMKKEGVPMIPIRFLVERGGYREFQEWYANYWHDEARSMLKNEAAEKYINPGFYFGALYAQAWYFIYFLNEYEQGKYRKPFQDLVLTALRGREKPPAYRKDPNAKDERWSYPVDAFVEIFGVKSEADWARLQKEHDTLLEKVLADAPLPKKPLGAGEQKTDGEDGKKEEEKKEDGGGE